MFLTMIEVPKCMKSVKGYRRKAFVTYRYPLFKDKYEFIYLFWYNPKEESKHIITSIYYKKVGAPMETMQLVPDEVLKWGATLEFNGFKVKYDRMTKDERFSSNLVYNLYTSGKVSAFLIECSPINEFLDKYHLQILAWCLHQDKVHSGKDAIALAELFQKAMDGIAEIDGVGKYARVVNSINSSIEYKNSSISEYDEKIRASSEKMVRAKEKLAKLGFHE